MRNWSAVLKSGLEGRRILSTSKTGFKSGEVKSASCRAHQVILEADWKVFVRRGKMKEKGSPFLKFSRNVKFLSDKETGFISFALPGDVVVTIFPSQEPTKEPVNRKTMRRVTEEQKGFVFDHELLR